MSSSETSFVAKLSTTIT